MKNLESILDLYTRAPGVRHLAESLARTQRHCRLSGLAGAQESFLLSGLYRAAPRTHLFIAGDKEEAAYIQNNIAGLLPNTPVVFFPDSFKRPQYFEELNRTNVLERTEAINKIITAQQQPPVIVTYPEAVVEMVVEPAVLSQASIEVQVGQNLDLDFIIELMLTYGFRREDFVYEPGQFSVRGAIVDIFSHGNDYPYRIELMDEEVESVRTFDPLSQLSVQRLSKVAIIPNVTNHFESSQMVSLLTVFKEDTVIWMSDLSLLDGKMQSCLERAEAFLAALAPGVTDDEGIAWVRKRTFVMPEAFIKALTKFSTVNLGTPAPVSFSFGNEVDLVFNGRPQPSFNRNFNLLIDTLHENSARGIVNFIFTDNPKQVERFYAIFEDLEARVRFEPVMQAISQGFLDEELKIACFTDHQIFQRHHHYKLKRGFTADKAISLKMLRELQPEDYVVHIDHGVGKYSGLEKITVNGHTQESVRIFYKNNDVLYVSINALHKLSKFVGKDGTPPALSKLGSEAWQNLKSKTRKKIKDIAKELIKLYAVRKASPGFAFAPDNYLQTELESSFIYEDTPDQEKATFDVKSDMMKPHPMDRLICGDVGFGKTEVAIRATFKAVLDAKQVAVLVPTTILALQHFKTFSERLADFDLKIDYLNRFRSTKERNDIVRKLNEGKVDIVIGTHALLNKEVQFKDLGLLIVDEEQKFGVSAKERLRAIKANVDTLTLTATPIPRTLQFSLMAARDLSIIRTPPTNRQPIHTEIRVFNETLIKDAISKEVQRGGQVFFVHNSIKTLPDMVALIKRLLPDVEVAMAHGQMESNTLEKTLVAFIDKQSDVLVCTNIIETGLDIPNANTMIVNNTHHFGLSDLHQLRGRIGRSNKKAYCYLFSPPLSAMTHDARKRLRTIEEFSDLGSGFEIAMRDLDIRGAGNLLGAEQSGFIADIGYETFQRILEEAIQELKETDFKDVFREELEKRQFFVRDVQVDTDTEMHIPDEYITSISERLSLYTRLDKLETEQELLNFESTLRDRFGKIPKPVHELFHGLRLRWVARELGFERIVLKSKKLRCYFVENPQSPFYDSAAFQDLFQFIATKGEEQGIGLKKSPRSLIMTSDGVPSLKAARELLEKVRRSLNLAAFSNG